MNLYKLAWLIWIVGIILIVLTWDLNVSADVKRAGVVIAWIGVVLFFIHRVQVKMKQPLRSPLRGDNTEPPAPEPDATADPTRDERFFER